MTGFVIDSSALLSVVIGAPDAELAPLVWSSPFEKSSAPQRSSKPPSHRSAGEASKRATDSTGSSRASIRPSSPSTNATSAGRETRSAGSARGRHAAALNLGDCIAYATARHEVLPLLFKGDDIAQTDLERA